MAYVLIPEKVAAFEHIFEDLLHSVREGVDASYRPPEGMPLHTFHYAMNEALAAAKALPSLYDGRFTTLRDSVRISSLPELNIITVKPRGVRVNARAARAPTPFTQFGISLGSFRGNSLEQVVDLTDADRHGLDPFTYLKSAGWIVVKSSGERTSTLLTIMRDPTWEEPEEEKEQRRQLEAAFEEMKAKGIEPGKKEAPPLIKDYKGGNRYAEMFSSYTPLSPHLKKEESEPSRSSSSPESEELSEEEIARAAEEQAARRRALLAEL